MKTRNGFVSNSSSSSFIVRKSSWMSTEKIQKLDKKQLNVLKSIGFYECYASFPSHLDIDESRNTHLKVKSKDAEFVSYGYTVICNEDEVLRKLIKNKISFTADVHYSHEYWEYVSETDTLTIVQNFGVQYSMSSSKQEIRMTPKFKTIQGSDWLKD